MASVVNNVVKMDWEQKGFLTKNKGSIFNLASKEYEGANGTVAVFFTSKLAFVFDSNEGTGEPDTWLIDDMIPWLKSNMSNAFPTQYGETMIIARNNAGVEFNVTNLEKYGIAEFKEDIENRLLDVYPYGVEYDEGAK